MKYKRQAYSVKRIEQFNPEFHRLFAKRYSLNAHSRGFTLLLAALVSSVVLALGVSIFEIALKQVTLSSMGRESQFAFYAADTGAECALYWDVRNDIHPNTFATSTLSSPASGVSCDEPTYITPAAVTPDFRPDGSVVSTFQFEPSGKCAQVSVRKCNTDGLCDSLNPSIHTVIHADGFNTACASIGSSARSLQRSVELHY